MVVARQGEPLLDSELNLMQQIVGEKLDRFVHQLALTGWTKAPGYPVSSVPYLTSSTTDLTWNDAFNTLTFTSDAWLVAKGMFIHVANPDLAVYPGGYQVNLSGTLPSSGLFREDLLFIEFWFEEIGPDGIGLTDTASRDILKEGGVGNGVYAQADVNESLVDPLLNIETTRRVQLRWRLRVVESTGSPVGSTISMFPTYAWGLSSNTGTPNTAINAMGANTAVVAGYPFQVVESPPSISAPIGSPPYLLWRTAVPADPKAAASALKTVDGYSYAVPMLKLIRDSGNGLRAADLRTPSRLYIPDHSIHARQLAPGNALNGAGVTGGLSTNGTVIEPETVKGGVGGDVGPHTITTYNLAAGTVDEDALGDGVVNIENINANVGLPTRLLTNNTSERVYNGSVVFVVGDTFVPSDVANPTTLPIMGVVEHHVRNSAQNFIEPGFAGYVRLAGIAAGTLTSGTVSVNNYLISTTPAVASYYPGVAGVVNAFGQVMKTYAHDAGDPVGLNRADILMFGEVIPDASVDSTKIAATAVRLSHINNELLTGGDDAPLLRKLGRSGTSFETAHDRALPADDPRLSDSRPPTGLASGDLTGSYPGPSIATGAVTTSKIASNTIVPGNINPTYIDGAQGTPSLRRLAFVDTVLGGGAIAVADNSPALTNSRPPIGTAGGSLVGAYPSPTLGSKVVLTANINDLAVTNGQIGPLAVTTDKLIDSAITPAKIAASAVTTSKIAPAAVDWTRKGLVPALRLGQYDVGTQYIEVTGTSAEDIIWVQADYDTMASAGFAPSWSAGTPTYIQILIPGIYHLSLTVNWMDQGPGLRGLDGTMRECSISFFPSTAVNLTRNRSPVPVQQNVYTLTHGCSTYWNFTAPTIIVCSVRHTSDVRQQIGGEYAWANTFQMLWVAPPV